MSSKSLLRFTDKGNVPRIEFRTAGSYDTTPCGLLPAPVREDENNQTALLAEHLRFMRRVPKIAKNDY